jgi:hypothetical protein
LITGEELPHALPASEGASLNLYFTWVYRFRKASDRIYCKIRDTGVNLNVPVTPLGFLLATNHDEESIKMNKTIPALLILSSTASFAATIQLSGIRDLNDTAIVSNESLFGSVFSFTIQNTAPVGIIANVGLSFGNTLRLSSFTTSAPFQYNIQNNTVAPDFNFPLDFAMAGGDQTKGLIPGESENFTWDSHRSRWNSSLRYFSDGHCPAPGCQIPPAADGNWNRSGTWTKCRNSGTRDWCDRGYSSPRHAGSCMAAS